jgi:hypothetical protein
MIDRRRLMKSAVSLAIAPALPAVAGMTPIGVKPAVAPSEQSDTMVPSSELRAAFDAYIDAYRAFFAVAPSELPDDNDPAQTDEERAAWQGALDRCRAWRRTKRRLANLVIEANGYNNRVEELEPPTVESIAVDLGDVWVVVSGDPDYEGVEGYSCMWKQHVSVVPRSPAMKARINALPSWPEDDVCDDTWHRPFHYQSYAEPGAEWTSAEEDDAKEDDKAA